MATRRKRQTDSGKQNAILAAAQPQDDAAIPILGDVEIHAAAAAEGGAAKGPPTFSIIAYNGGALSVDRYSLPVVIDLAGLSFANDIKANLDHEQSQRVGHITAKATDGKRITLEGVISGTGTGAQEVIANAANGYPWKASIEALPTAAREHIAEGSTVTVNGQTFKGPLLVARKSKLYGVAFLGRAADEKTSVKIAAKAAGNPNPNPKNPKGTEMEFTQWIEAMGFTLDDLTAAQKASLQKKYDAEITAAKKQDDDDAPPVIAAPAFDLDELKAAHTDLLADIEARFAEHEDEVRDPKKLTEIKAASRKTAKELKAKGLKEKWCGLRYEAEAIRAASAIELQLVQAKSPAGPAIIASTKDLSNETIEAALCLSLGMPDVEKQFKEPVLEAASRNPDLRNIGLQQLLIMAAQANGYPGRAYRIHAGNHREILEYAFPPIRAAFSTLDVRNILSNVANKELLMGFEEEDSAWREIAAVKPVNDFKAVTSYRLQDDMIYEEVGADGEIHHGTLSEDSYTRQAKTYAKMFSLSRTDQINDDLGAFDDLRTRLGKGAAIKFNNVFWATFLDALATFFTAGRGNYFTGAGTVLDSAGLTTGVLTFRKRTTPEGRRAGGTPKILLVPPDLEADADELYASRFINTGGSSTKAKVPDNNTHAAKYRPVVANYLSDTGFNAAASTTHWFLLQDPRVMACIVASFLNGQQSPTIESADAAFNILGIEFRGYHDFGVDMAEYTAGVMSKGAA